MLLALRLPLKQLVLKGVGKAKALINSIDIENDSIYIDIKKGIVLVKRDYKGRSKAAKSK